MAVPKKRLSKSKKRNRKSLWKNEALSQSLRAYSIARSFEQKEQKK